MRVRDAAADTPLTPADVNIKRAVKGLWSARDLTQGDVADGIGMARSTFNRRLNGGFSAADVAALADFFGVEVSDLYTGLGGKLAPAARATTRAYLHNRRSAWVLAA